MAANANDALETVLAQVRETRETADEMANRESPKPGGDDIRVRFGMVRQVGEQAERLAEPVEAGLPKRPARDPMP